MSHFQAAYKELSLRNSSYRVQFAGIYSVIDDITIATVVVVVLQREKKSNRNQSTKEEGKCEEECEEGKGRGS